MERLTGHCNKARHMLTYRNLSPSPESLLVEADERHTRRLKGVTAAPVIIDQKSFPAFDWAKMPVSDVFCPYAFSISIPLANYHFITNFGYAELIGSQTRGKFARCDVVGLRGVSSIDDLRVEAVGVVVEGDLQSLGVQ